MKITDEQLAALAQKYHDLGLCEFRRVVRDEGYSVSNDIIDDSYRKYHETDPPKTTISFKQEGQSARVDALTSDRIHSLEDLIGFFKIDINVWKVKRWECTSYESHTKLRRYVGKDRQSDKHITVPLYRVWAQLEENRPLVLLADVKSTMMAEMKKHAPIYGKLKYPKVSDGHMLEVNLFDLHFGKLVWDQEAGDNYDIKIARDIFLKVIAQVLHYSKIFPIDRILFPVGNDFFNVDNEANTTTGGTPQDEDTRWKKTFVDGRKLVIEAIDRMREIAPVDVPVIPGNHDAERAFYLGDSLECWYHGVSGVTIDNGAKIRKYYRYGSNLIGFTHGKDEKPEELPNIMASEVPEYWSSAKFREWHLGDKHHKRELHWQSTKEYKGVIVRYMRSLTATDVWHHKKGFIGNLRAGEAFVWSKDGGAIAQFTASI
jgi:hypothetical protein